MPLDYNWIRKREKELSEQGIMICDFCLEPNPVCCFAAPAMKIGTFTARDDGWASCEICAQLLEKHRLTELRIRINEAHVNKLGHSWNLTKAEQIGVLEKVLPTRFTLDQDVTWSKIVFEGHGRTGRK